MITRPNGTTSLAALLLASTLAAVPLGAQAGRDSTRRWALFGGMAAVDQLTGPQRIPDNFEIGGSGDFHVGAFPLPLRATLAFSHAEQRYLGADLKFGTFSLDAVGRPLPKVLGTQLYLLGGLGVGTRAAFFGSPGNTVLLDPRDAYTHPRQSWTFLEGGAGLDVGRLFMQFKLQAPVASNGPWRAPVSVGFRF